jgi:ABC-type methionine transport system ATPase subunit
MSTSVRLTFPEELRHEPVVAQLVRRFDVEPNIRGANVEAGQSWLICDLDGTHEAVEGAVAWLEEIGVVVDRLGEAPET